MSLLSQPSRKESLFGLYLSHDYHHLQGRALDEEDLAMDLAAEGGLSLVVRYHGEVVAALIGTAVAAPTSGLSVMQLQLVAVNPNNSDAAEVGCILVTLLHAPARCQGVFAF